MMNKEMNILIVGLGLLGGSYAASLSSQGYKVNGIDSNSDSIDYGLKMGWIEKGSSFDDELLIQNADLLILGLYPSVMIDWVKNNRQYFKSGLIITDVSGVKGAIVTQIQSLLQNDVEFVSSHPMAGKEVSGIQNSDPSIFKKANFILILTDKNTPKGLAMIRNLAEILSFNHITELTIEKHDELIGFVSQLTHVIAVCLMNSKIDPLLVEVTGDSFRDLTRIAKINENLWSELFLLNKDKLLSEIEGFQNELENFKRVLQNEDVDMMKKLFIQSTNQRKLFDKKEN